MFQGHSHSIESFTNVGVSKIKPQNEDSNYPDLSGSFLPALFSQNLRRFSYMLRFTLSLVIIILFSGCAKKTEDETVIPASDLYRSALQLLEQGYYEKAADGFEKIFFQHPGNAITPQSELMQAYSLYLGGKYEEAVDILDNFIALHPINVDISYAYYLKSLAFYMQISNVHLDQSRTAGAKAALEDVIKRFPNTKYAVDAALKIDLVNEHLAGKEMDVGRYYLHINDPIAAILRFQNVVSLYPTTSHVQEALYRLTESYAILGINAEAKKFAAVLGHNYPSSKWYRYSYDLITKVSAK